MVTGNVRQGRSTNRPEHYGNFGCRQNLHENIAKATILM